MKKKFFKGASFNLALLALFGVNIGAILLAGEDPRIREAMWASIPALHFTSAYPAAWNQVIYDLNLASVVSLLFYWLIVWLPDQRKRARLKRSFMAEYRSYRLDCIEIFLLMADGSFPVDLPETLLSQSTFRNYFKVKITPDEQRWDRVANGLQGYHLKMLLNRMESFREEIAFVLNNVTIESDEALALVKQLSHMIRSASIIEPGYDLKQLLSFHWSVLTGWSFVTGYPAGDVIEDLIKEL